jgi:mannitol-1-/sugar-/sorbitol-6-/2-deoxyglucose-6-phosphatase
LYLLNKEINKMEGLEAIIFDMDGVLIDSEPLWRVAMIQGFNEAGVEFTDDDCRKTTGMRFKEVVEHWFEEHQIEGHTTENVHNSVIHNLIRLIQEKGKPMKGAIEALEFFRAKGYKVGLATSSSQILVDAILKKLNAYDYFSAITSAEFLQQGKPHPEVFLKCAGDLGIHPKKCLVIEDSVNGVIAGKAAGMKVVAIPDREHKNDPRFVIADHCFESLLEVMERF